MKIPVLYKGSFERVSIRWIEKRKKYAVLSPTISVDVDAPIVIVESLINSKVKEILRTIGVRTLDKSVLYMGRVTTINKLVKYWMQEPFYVGQKTGIGVVKDSKLGRKLFGEFYVTDRPTDSRFLVAGTVFYNLTIPSPHELKNGNSEIARMGRLAISRGCPATLGYKIYYMLKGILHESCLTMEERKLTKRKFKDIAWFVS